ncbi:hypothetical protein ACU5DF_04445 [Aliivibrio wodanis]|uniref:Uncharacterized protein n=1 Tax=Aliivibrio wodanis TaxID=80852 RepID=A0A090I5M3_9GAMM|nr:putative uncharacterized protein [Aliivibrio wodanis]VVV06599.1 hypothetical protein AW0309160_04093 [Aliivibrio wodanis]
MKVEAVGKIQTESIARDRRQESLKSSIIDMKMSSASVYDQQAIDFALKRGELREKEIESRAYRLRIYMDQQRKLNKLS